MKTFSDMPKRKILMTGVFACVFCVVLLGAVPPDAPKLTEQQKFSLAIQQRDIASAAVSWQNLSTTVQSEKEELCKRNPKCKSDSDQAEAALKSIQEQQQKLKQTYQSLSVSGWKLNFNDWEYEKEKSDETKDHPKQ